MLTTRLIDMMEESQICRHVNLALNFSSVWRAYSDENRHYKACIRHVTQHWIFRCVYTLATRWAPPCTIHRVTEGAIWLTASFSKNHTSPTVGASKFAHFLGFDQRLPAIILFYESEYFRCSNLYRFSPISTISTNTLLIVSPSG